MPPTLRRLAVLAGALTYLALPTVQSPAGAAEPTLLAAGDSPGLVLGPAKAPRPFADGTFRTKHSELDTGKPALLFDGSYDTLIRTPQVNPMYLTLAAGEPVSFHGIRVKTTGDRHEYTLAAAASDEDLERRSGTYRVLARGTTENGDVVFTSGKPVTYAAFRLDLKRLEGDEYVHISEWEFLDPVRLKDMEVSYKTRTAHGGEAAVYQPLDATATRPEDSLLIPRVLATREDGKVFDATGVADIRFRSRHGKPWRGNKMLHLRRPESVGVTVRLGDLKQEGRVKVTPRPVQNRAMDLDVLYVERLPRLDFDGPNGGWPAAGQRVLWRAHVHNWGTEDVAARYRWTLDGKDAGGGTLELPAGREATVDLPWTWVQARHNLAFEIAPKDRVTELVAHNNRVEFATDALAVGFYVDRSYADYYHEHQHKLGLDDANSFADWGQRVVRHWNRMSARSTYPGFPEGIRDRVRLDRVLVVPDQAVPFQGGDWPTNFPNLEDRSVDLIWGFPYKTEQMDKPFDLAPVKKAIDEGNTSGHPFFLDIGLIHELFHARGIIDSYGFDVHADSGKEPKDSNIRIQDDQGRYIVGTYLQAHGMVHGNKYPGIMGGGGGQFGPYEVMAWNRIAGKRARQGNANGTSLIGDYLQDIPKSFRIRFVGPQGEILANAPVKVYWAAAREGWYAKDYDNVPDRAYITGTDGTITADATLFAKDGKIIHGWGHANSVPIVRVDHAGRTYYVFLEVSELNMLANTSKEDVPTMDLVIPLRTGDPVPLPVDYGRVILPDWRLRTAFLP